MLGLGLHDKGGSFNFIDVFIDVTLNICVSAVLKKQNSTYGFTAMCKQKKMLLSLLHLFLPNFKTQH